MIQNSSLSNLRWLCIQSHHLGRDWFEKTQEMDQNLEDLGLDLADANVYLLFSRSPREVLEDGGDCLIGRSVVGPKKEMLHPFSLIDWKAIPVWRETISGDTFDDLLHSSEILRSEIVASGRNLQNSFILCIKRRLDDELRLWIEVLFYE